MKTAILLLVFNRVETTRKVFEAIRKARPARPGCIRQAISKIKPGGFLVLDNSERVEYTEGISIVSGWKSIKYIGPAPNIDYQSETRIWQK